jgi:hypothetical protein
MHNLHFIIINADSAADAVESALLEIQDWGNENNWRRVGGVASEDGKDVIENHQDARWGLSYLKPEESVLQPRYFQWGIQMIWDRIHNPLTLPYRSRGEAATIKDALMMIASDLLTFDGEDAHQLWCASKNLLYLQQIIGGRQQAKTDNIIPSFYAWELDECGLTDLTEDSEGSQSYLVMIDMHS